MRPGQQLTLSIDHQTDFGYFLTDGEDTILLHNSEMTEDIEDRDEVEVFIYVRPAGKACGHDENSDHQRG